MAEPQNDPLFNQQWYLRNTGQTGGTVGADINVASVWADYRGRGVSIAVVDTGVDYNHPDIAPNYDATKDFNTIKKINDGRFDTSLASFQHGTNVTGLIAGAANGTGLVGAAPEAKVSGIVGLGDASLFASTQFDISSNSWGVTTLFGDNPFSTTFEPYLNALVTGAETGRNGLGTIFVFAAGNAYDLAGRTGLFYGFDNANYHGLQNSSYTIAVAALDSNGTFATERSTRGYSTPGAPILVSAPGTAVLTTDIVGSQGSPGDFATVSGTSFAAPLVSGVVALMLEANPGLGYRDVQEILAYSARQNHPSETGWFINGADNWNGGGLHKNFNYGFGIVDAHAAVRLAETWSYQAVFDNSTVITRSIDEGTFGATLSSTARYTKSVTFTETLEIDHAQVGIDISHDRIGDLEIYLTSPAGTRSTLLIRPGDGTTGGGRLVFNLTSTDFWGESAAGTWTLEIIDRTLFNSGRIDEWNLRLVGDTRGQDDIHVFTNEFASFASADADRLRISDGQGYNVFNAAAVTTPVTVDLAAQSVAIGGRNINLSGSVFAQVHGGDAGDRLIGGTAGDWLNGARGDDLIDAGAGDDTLFGGTGNDTLNGSAGFDIVRFDQPGNTTALTALNGLVVAIGPEGRDVLASVEVLEFNNRMVFALTAQDAEIARLYEAALDRQAEPAGLRYWTGVRASGQSADAIADVFAASAEFRARYGAVDDAGYVNRLYLNVLGRTADPGGFGFWTGLLATGNDRGAVLLGFSNSAENVAGTVSSILIV